MPLITITGPAAEPVTDAEVRAAARIESDDAAFSGPIALAIAAARGACEQRTGRPLINQTLEMVLDAFPEGEIGLGVAGVTSITSVKYLDEAGVQQTLAAAAYSLDDVAAPCAVVPATGTSWPATIDAVNAVRVRFVAGYGAAAASVPGALRQWIVATAARMLRTPDGLVANTIREADYLDRLLDPFVVWEVR